MAPFTHCYRVTYADCTVGNHIYYGRYLALLEAARGELFRSLGASLLHWQNQGMAFPVTECSLRYRAPAQYDDELRIEVTVRHAAGARLGFGYRVINQAPQLILEAETLHACTTLTGKPRRLPQALVALLSRNQS